MESTLREYNSPRKLLRIATTMGVRGKWNSRCRSVDRPVTFLHEFAYSVCSLDSRKTTQLRNLGFCRQHLATLATSTIISIKCKQSPVYGVFWPLLPHPSTDRNELGLPFPARNLPIQFGTIRPQSF